MSKKTQKPLVERLPWALIIAPGIIVNKDSSFQATFEFRGIDPLSNTRERKAATTKQLNRIFKQFGNGWAVFTELQKRKTTDYSESLWPHKIAEQIEKEQKRELYKEPQFIAKQYISFVYLPPPDIQSRVKNTFYTDNDEINQNTVLRFYSKEIKKIKKLLSSPLPFIKELNDDETLTYLHGTISTVNQVVKSPGFPILLDSFLTDEAVVGGYEPKLGDNYLKLISVKGFPLSTQPFVNEALANIPHEFRWVSRFIFLEKPDAIKEFQSYATMWANKRSSIKDIIVKMIFRDNEKKENPHATEMKEQAEESIFALEMDAVGGGYYTQVIVLWDKDEDILEEKERAVVTTLRAAGFVVVSEKLNALKAWFSSLPGDCLTNVRRPLISSMDYSNLIPSCTTPYGVIRNKHLDGPPLFIAKTNSNSLYGYSSHVEDVGSSLILGPTGRGKSTFLNYSALCFQKYKNAKIFFFDNEYSSYVNTLINGGAHYDIGLDDRVTFQPLRHIDDEKERSWASDWLVGILTQESVKITPKIKNELWQALTLLASMNISSRTLSHLCQVVQNQEIETAIKIYTSTGPYGYLFDSIKDNFSDSNWQTFEMMNIIKNMPGALGPLSTYLFHVIRKTLKTGQPTLIVFDEGKIFLEIDSYKNQIEEFLNTIRKSNASMNFATTSLMHITQSGLKTTFIDGCPTKIYLPNPMVKDKENYQLYKDFSLNEVEIKIIEEAKSKEEYYCTSPNGNRKFSLGLSELALTVCASSSKEDIRKMKEIYNNTAIKEELINKFLVYKGVQYEV